MHVVHRMAGSQVLVRIPLLDQSSGVVRPCIVAILIQIVTEVPGDVGERGESRDGVADKAALVWTRGSGMGTAVVHVQDEGENHIPVAGEAKSSLEFLPVGNLKAGIVESWMVNVVRPSETTGVALPGGDKRSPTGARHHRFAVIQAGSAGDGYSQPVDLQLMQALNAGLDHLVVPPTDQPIG